MRKIQKILTGIFLGGVLLGGIGTGVALVEYSSLAYGGERMIGEENLVTREIDYSFVPEQEQITIADGYWTDHVEVDDTVPEGIIRYVVTYNEKTVKPTLYFREANDKNQSPDPREISLELHVQFISSDLALLMECKDEILEKLKQKKIFSYNIAYVTDVKILVNSKSIPYIHNQYTSTALH